MLAKRTLECLEIKADYFANVSLPRVLFVGSEVADEALIVRIVRAFNQCAASA